MVVKSFARIHVANLINAGILPLTFANEADYDTLELGHELCLPDVRRRLMEGEPVELLDRTTGRTIPLCHNFSERQIAMLLAGGLLDYTREQNA